MDDIGLIRETALQVLMATFNAMKDGVRYSPFKTKLKHELAKMTDTSYQYVQRFTDHLDHVMDRNEFFEMLEHGKFLDGKSPSYYAYELIDEYVKFLLGKSDKYIPI